MSTKPYIGTRDFFPENMDFRSWMFQIQHDVCKRFGYRLYDAPILEPLSLYQKKSSEEIVNEQLYSFKDRGERDVAIRPEMTPTLARMVAGSASSRTFPLRWYSIGNFMRYERPGRGRLREFFQLNVDLIGPSSVQADAEILMIAIELLLSYGASLNDFQLRYSDRRLLDVLFQGMTSEQARSTGRLLDKREKIGEEEFYRQLADVFPENYSDVESRIQNFLAINFESLQKKDSLDVIPDDMKTIFADLQQMEAILQSAGYSDCLTFDPGIVRGFDYYTGMIFEINDCDLENRRALFGGGRYDRLLGMFGKKDIPACGFGMGDVTLENFLEGRNLKKQIQNQTVYLTLMDESQIAENFLLATELRQAGIAVEMSLESTKKFGKQFEQAEKQNCRLALIQGADELLANKVRVKDIRSGRQEDVNRQDLIGYIQSFTGKEAL